MIVRFEFNRLMSMEKNHTYIKSINLKREKLNLK